MTANINPKEVFASSFEGNDTHCINYYFQGNYISCITDYPYTFEAIYFNKMKHNNCMLCSVQQQ